MSSKNESTERFGGPGSSHQDREHPGKNNQDTGHKDGGGRPGALPHKDTPPKEGVERD